MSELEKTLDRGIRLLEEYLPAKTHLYFPILYSACVWAVRRVFDLRDRVFAWQAWLEPALTDKKPDVFVLDFFKSLEGLKVLYGGEIKKEDYKALRKSFSSLYPVCGLEDTFLKALFEKELEAGEYRAIDQGFKSRASESAADVAVLDGRTEFWDGLEGFSVEMASLGIHLLSDAELKALIKDRVAKRLGKD
jgi:hypothetical protein